VDRGGVVLTVWANVAGWRPSQCMWPSGWSTRVTVKSRLKTVQIQLTITGGPDTPLSDVDAATIINFHVSTCKIPCKNQEAKELD
jgi:hypothetical protein